MKILVTGASGYIGQHLCRRLVEDGWDVRGLSRSPRPHCLPMVQWFQGDICDAEIAQRAADDVCCIFHLAGLSLSACDQNPAQALVVNVQGAFQMLEIARRQEVEKFILASSGQVYGGHNPIPNNETQIPMPASPYAASKLCAETWCLMAAQAHSLPVTILRLFNVYGPALDGGLRPTVDAIFLRRLLNGEKPQIMDNLQSGRDFIYVDDVIMALQLALVSPAFPHPINIGTGVLTTLKGVALSSARVLGSHLQPDAVEIGGKPVRFQADTLLARQELGFKAEVSLEDGLRRYLEKKGF
jgi:UDP-glucose 4-epimerase